jgi:hypothetical protein
MFTTGLRPSRSSYTPSDPCEAGAPFLERTREKLEDRARAIIERRPDLEYYFGDLIPANAFREINTREIQLEAALRANAALRVQAERLIGAYVAPESDRAGLVDELIRLFDGPAQREARRLAAEALGVGWWEHRS